MNKPLIIIMVILKFHSYNFHIIKEIMLIDNFILKKIITIIIIDGYLLVI